MKRPKTTPHNYSWEILSQTFPITPQVNDALRDYPSILRQLFFNREIYNREQAEEFLSPTLDRAHDPWLMKGMRAAIDRICFAIRRREKIAIYGDYDVDGVSATALLYDFLETLGADVHPYIPNRFEEGYGVKQEGLRALKEEGTKLVITVDCGARANIEAEYARSIGLDLIVTDHHQPHQENPHAIAMLNPKQKDETYPYPNLSGVGIAYKLVQALQQTLNSAKPDMTEYLDLVALGTIADITPLNGENRILVANGLAQLRKTQRIGLRALAAISGTKLEELNTYHVGYLLAPRLNAAGRLESASAAFELLTTRNPQKALQLAQELDNRNRERQEITLQHDLQAIEQVERYLESTHLLVAYDPSFNSGVIGLVAAHLVETFYRPAVVATEFNGFIRGSCRSIPEFHITEALDECCDLMEYHGGHAAAAGFTIRKERFAEFVYRLQEIAREQLGSISLKPKLRADLPIDLSKLGKLLLEYPLIQYLDKFEPTGYGNPSPSFVSFGLSPKNIKRIGRDQTHLRFDVPPGWKCIAFRCGELAEIFPPKVDILYHIEKNTYNGNNYLQLNVRDIKPTTPPK
ncbi:MAG: single-stranded-DNA-specific exonuclease RecJ [Anaerolineales bacterium]|nr:single-stranded-DNA-specific exonuclease RecJ [Anaerolineales bacterium]